MFSKYNIDALRNEDGTYRPAHAPLIKGALQAGHTTHLQTERGTVAFRPYTIEEVRINKRTGEQYFPGEKAGKNWLVEFFPADMKSSHDHKDEHTLYTSNLTEAMRFAYLHLNGSLDTLYQPNDMIEVFANQAEREGYVLATIGDEVLVEYEMPGTTSKWAGHPAQPTSALRIIRTIGLEEIGAYKSVSYNNVPKKWLAAIRAADMTNWIGMGQRSRTRIPFPGGDA